MDVHKVVFNARWGSDWLDGDCNCALFKHAARNYPVELCELARHRAKETPVGCQAWQSQHAEISSVDAGISVQRFPWHTEI